MKRPTAILRTAANAALVAGIVAGVLVGVLLVKYVGGSWAPTSFRGGLQFAARPQLTDARGSALPDEASIEFMRLCGELRSTTRDIGENRGEGFVTLRSPAGGDNDHLTIYPEMGVVFHGWWTDAKTYTMMDRRAPCFELSTGLHRFFQEHGLIAQSIAQDGGQP